MFGINISCFFDDPVVDAPMRYRCEPASYCYLATEWWSTGTNRAREKDTFLAPPKPEKSSIYDVVVSKDCSTSTVSPHYPETIGPTFWLHHAHEGQFGVSNDKKSKVQVANRENALVAWLVFPVRFALLGRALSRMWDGNYQMTMLTQLATTSHLDNGSWVELYRLQIAMKNS